jgi:hypothetical protein
MGTLTVSKLNDISSYRASSTALSGFDVMEISLSGTTGYVSAKCTLDNLKAYFNEVPANTTYKVFDIFYRTINETPLLITYANAVYTTDLTLYSAWPLFIDSTAAVADASINIAAPNWIAKYNGYNPSLNIQNNYPTLWSKLQEATSGIGGAFTDYSKIKWEAVNVNNAGQIANSQYMQDYNTYGYTGRFLIDINNGLVAAPILNNSFIRNVSNGVTNTVSGLGTSETDIFKSHNHNIYTNGGGSGYIGINPETAGINSILTATILPSGNTETRPKNIRYCPYMQIANTVTDLSIVNVNAALSAVNIPFATIAQVGVFSTTASATTSAVISPYTLTNAFALSSNQNITLSGYQKFPGGLIMQWGKYPLPTNNPSNFDIAFPISFGTCLNAQATCTNAAETHGNTSRYWVDISSISNTILRLTTASADNENFHAGEFIYWTAIGY